MDVKPALEGLLGGHSPVYTCKDLNKEVPQLIPLREQIDVDFVLQRAKPIHKFPQRLREGRFDHKKEVNVLIVLDDSEELGYCWDLCEAENRENGCARVRAGINRSDFEDCQLLWFCEEGDEQLEQFCNFPATCQRLYAPMRGEIRETAMEVLNERAARHVAASAQQKPPSAKDL